MAQPHPTAVLSDVTSCVAEVLGLPEPTVDPSAPLINLGLESFTAVRLRRRLRERTGVDLPFTEFFGQASCATVAAALTGAAPNPSTVDSPVPERAAALPPVAEDLGPGSQHAGSLTPTQWAALRARAQAHERTVAGTLLAALGLTLSRWCDEPVPVRSTLTDGDENPGVAVLATLAAPDLLTWKAFAQYAEEVDRPRVQGAPPQPEAVLGQAVREEHGGARITWGAAAHAVPEALLPGMFAAHLRLLDRLGDDATWTDPTLGWDPTCTAPQPPAVSPYPGAGPLLDDPLRRAAEAKPQAMALLGPAGQVSHGRLAALAGHNAAALRALGIGPGDLVAVACPKGPAQIAAVLGVTATGAGFVPVSPSWPAARVAAVCAAARVRHAVIGHSVVSAWPPRVRSHRLDPDGQLPAGPLPHPRHIEKTRDPKPHDLAYAIFTSGSTGIPKGVAIEHQAARTTIDDITDRFEVVAGDRVLALSALSFDLSIYDIFGVLGAGGAVVLPDEHLQRDPRHWLDLMAAHRVTVWNTAPALLEMLVEDAEGRRAEAEAALATLRLVLLSGDWIPVTLPDRLRALAPQARVVSLGGATEASIWSICHPIDEVDPAWSSIPYGRPLRGQSFHILDRDGRPCRVGETGELHIGGAGLARGYIGDPAQTARRFIQHDALGERLYRTGDLGRWRVDGTIEFLGRLDRQVKIRGHRIELGEIESVLNRHPQVRQCVAAAVRGPDSQRRLVAYVAVHDPATVPTPETLRAALRAHLPDYMVPTRIVFVDTFAVTANGKIDYAALPDPYRSDPRAGVPEGQPGPHGGQQGEERALVG